MTSPSLQHASESFAANRAVGHVRLEAFAADGITRRGRVQEEGSLRIRFPGAPAQMVEGVIVNTAGGIAGGDRFAVTAQLGENAGVTITTAAAEKVYRSLGPDAIFDVRLAAAAGARLFWMPQETILFDEARLRRSIEIDLEEGAEFVLVEMLVFGRTAMGETVRSGSLFDRWRLRRGGKLIFAETTRLDGAIAEKLGARAVAGGGVAVATILAVPADDGMAEKVRELCSALRCEVAISAWNGFAVVRLLAAEASLLRQDLIAVLTILGAPPPRLWLN